MLRIINRMIMKDLLWTFILAIAGINSLLVLEPLIRFSKKLVGASAGFLYIIKLIILIQPKVLVFSLPLAMVVSLVATYGRLSIDNELIVLRASGAKMGSLFGPAIVLIISVTAFSFLTAHLIGPQADRTMRRDLNEFARKNLFGSIEPDVFFQTIKGLTMLVGKRHEDNSLKGVFIFQDTDPPRIITAEEARWIEGETGKIFLKKGQICLPKGREIIEISFNEYIMKIPLPQDVVGISRASMSDRELIHRFKGSGKRVFLVELLRRFNLPLVNIPLGLIGLVLSVSSGHSGRMKGFLLTVGLYGGYYAALILMENLVITGKGNIVLIFLPFVLLMVLSFFLYRRVRE